MNFEQNMNQLKNVYNLGVNLITDKGHRPEPVWLNITTNIYNKKILIDSFKKIKDDKANIFFLDKYSISAIIKILNKTTNKTNTIISSNIGKNKEIIGILREIFDTHVIFERGNNTRYEWKGFMNIITFYDQEDLNKYINGRAIEIKL